MPTKIASMKNAAPSSENGRPMMPPAKAMNRGHSSPSSKLMIVPEAAPTANRIANTFDQRRASARHVGIAGTQMHPLGGQHHQRQPDPEHREEQMKAQRRSHLPATRRQVTDRTQHKQTHQRSPPPGPLETKLVRSCQADDTVLRSLVAGLGGRRAGESVSWGPHASH